MERAIEMLPKSSYFTSAYNQRSGLALLLSASLQRIGIMNYLTQTDKIPYFKKFLDSIYAGENFDFWQAVNRYRRHYQPNTQAGANLAIQLQNQYIVPNAPQVVNIAPNKRNNIMNQLMPGNNPHQQNLLNLFDNAQTEIYGLMANNSYHLLRENPLYQESINPNRSLFRGAKDLYSGWRVKKNVI